MNWRRRWGRLWCMLLGRHGRCVEIVELGDEHTGWWQCLRCREYVQQYKELL